MISKRIYRLKQPIYEESFTPEMRSITAGDKITLAVQKTVMLPL